MNKLPAIVCGAGPGLGLTVARTLADTMKLYNVPSVYAHNLDKMTTHEAIADVYMSLSSQKTSTWTHELDLRPMSENL